MKILLFTHRSDIDGMGEAILSKLAFDNVTYELCETFDINNRILSYIDNNKIYDYDMVYVTDLCPSEEVVEKVISDDKIKGKFKVFDHHKTFYNVYKDKYPFIKIKISNDKGLCCGTSLFYEYLVNEKLLDERKDIAEFVELTRQHDTWEWKNIYNNEKSHELALLFDSIGQEGYIKLIYDKLLNKKESFEYDDFEKMLIDNKKKLSLETLKNYASKIVIKEVYGLKAGILFIDYQYRSDLAEYLRSINYDVDFIMMMAMDHDSISFRSIKDGINVRKIAESFGGKGHDVAAACPIYGDTKEEIINIILKRRNNNE